MDKYPEVQMVTCNKCNRELPEYLIDKSGMCIDCYTYFLLHDPKAIAERENFAKLAGTLSAEQLNQRFTI